MAVLVLPTLAMRSPAFTKTGPEPGAAQRAGWGPHSARSAEVRVPGLKSVVSARSPMLLGAIPRPEPLRRFGLQLPVATGPMAALASPFALSQSVPRSSPDAVQLQVTLAGQRLQMVLQRMATRTGELRGFGYGDSTVLTGQLEDGDL